MTKKDILDYLYKYQEVFGILISLGSWFTVRAKVVFFSATRCLWQEFDLISNPSQLVAGQ